MRKKRICRQAVSLIFAALLVVALLPAKTLKVAAAQTICTRDEAVAWAKYQADHKVPFDIDGLYGNQCTDFATAYLNYVSTGDYRLNHPYTTRNGYQYFDGLPYPGDWQKIVNYPEFVPEPGDLLVWGTNFSEYGHVAVAIEGCTVNTAVCVQQNGLHNDWPAHYGNWGYKGFIGVIRPNWKPAPAPVTYTVSYNANGGSGAPAKQTKTQGTSLTLSTVKPTRTGYTFLGWATSSTATSAQYQPGGSYTADTNATLYAVWKLNQYTVTYNANGGSGAPAKQTKSYGTSLTLSTVRPTRDGYDFFGWATSSTATTAQYQPGDSYTTDANVKLYAVWKEKTIIGIAPQTVKIGENAEIPVYIEKSQMAMGVLTFKYDTSKLEYVSAAAKFAGDIDVNIKTPGEITIAAVCGSENLADGDILALTFKVIASEESQTTITITTRDTYNTEDLEISVTKVDGVITIVKPSLLGDVNLDEKVNIVDARWLLQVSSKNRVLTTQQASVADVNKDGKINIVDARWLLQVSSGNRTL